MAGLQRGATIRGRIGQRGADKEVLAVLGEWLGFDKGLLSVGESDDKVLAVGESVGFEEERGAIRTRLVGFDERVYRGCWPWENERATTRGWP